MNEKGMSLKSKIRNYAQKHNITAQVVLQNYMFEKFLIRLSQSKYKTKFIIKGGVLVSRLVGLDTRSTMDLDATLRNLPLTEQILRQTIEDIISIQPNDEVSFRITSITPIRKDDWYVGFCVKLEALYDNIIVPLSIDISTGDIITPSPIEYEINGILEDNIKIKLLAYNVETILAEKVETVLRRGIFTTRPRDYYDIYILLAQKTIDKALFREGLKATAEHRNSSKILNNIPTIMNMISSNEELKTLWSKYQRQYPYAKSISFENVIEKLKNLLKD